MTNRVHFETRSSSGETLAALPATVLDRGASRPGPHPMTEPVTALATPDFRLIGPLHDISEKVDKRGISARLRGQRTNSKFRGDPDAASSLHDAHRDCWFAKNSANSRKEHQRPLAESLDRTTTPKFGKRPFHQAISCGRNWPALSTVLILALLTHPSPSANTPSDSAPGVSLPLSSR